MKNLSITINSLGRNPVYLVILLLLLSCNDEPIKIEADNEIGESQFSTSIVTDKLIQSKLNEKAKELVVLVNESKVLPFSVDYSSLYQIEDNRIGNPSNQFNMYFYNQYSHNNGQKEWVFGLIEKNGKVVNAMYSRTFALSEYIKRVEYYDSNFNHLISVELDGMKSKVTNIEYPINANHRYECGDATAHCIEDAYTNHGWLSVGLAIMSVVRAEVALAVVGACAINECLL